MQRLVDEEIVDALSMFAISARRAMETMEGNNKFSLVEKRWEWEPTNGGEKVCDFGEALNRIIHARTMEVGFIEVPRHISLIEAGAICVPFVRAATDRLPDAFIDLFALSYGYLFEVVPELSTMQ